MQSENKLSSKYFRYNKTITFTFYVLQVTVITLQLYIDNVNTVIDLLYWYTYVM